MPDETTKIGEPIRLYGWEKKWVEAATPVKALLFGHMVKLATPVVKFYPSDLYHDVHWLDENVTGPTVFWFMVRESGTNIGESAITQEYLLGSQPRSLYRVELVMDERGQWLVTFNEYVHIRPVVSETV